MAGNVWEWTLSYYDDSKDSCVLHGGSFLYVRELFRSAYRYFDSPEVRLGDVGFRCSRIKL